jgi:hypothetical protein
LHLKGRDIGSFNFGWTTEPSVQAVEASEVTIYRDNLG